MFENPRRGRQARNFITNVSKILDVKSSSEQIFPENCRWVPLWIGLLLTVTDVNFYNLCGSHLQLESKWVVSPQLIVLTSSYWSDWSIKPWCYWLWRLVMSLVRFDSCIITVKQSLLLVKLSVDQSFSRSQFYLSPSIIRLYCAGNCLWLRFSGVVLSYKCSNCMMFDRYYLFKVS